MEIRKAITAFCEQTGIKKVWLSRKRKSTTVGVSDEGEPVWEESLDWSDLGICYFDLSKAIDQAKPEIARLETIVDPSPDNSSGLKLIVEIEGQETDDLQLALKEVSRLVFEDFKTGFDRNETGSYWFSIEGVRIFV
ncbi:MAG: hypothetical protein PHF31_12165 [Methylobacter sp.]|nr:hypothetical protein [Methylobacter sp.]